MRKKKIKLHSHDRFVKLGTKNKIKDYEFNGNELSPYESDFIQPKGKFWKRKSNKKIRKTQCIDGMTYKKLFGWMHWS